MKWIFTVLLRGQRDDLEPVVPLDEGGRLGQLVAAPEEGLVGVTRHGFIQWDLNG